MHDANREEGTMFLPKFDDRGLITAVVVDADTGEVLMVGFMNEATLRETISLGKAVFWSRSRNKRWMKGETSGHTLDVESILVDCDQDALVVRARIRTGCCHVGYRSCFYRRVTDHDRLEFVAEKVFDPGQVYGS